MRLKVGEPIDRAGSRLGLISSPQLDTRGIEVSLMSGESLLEAKEEGSSMKEEVCQEDTGVKETPLEIICSMTPVSLLQCILCSLLEQSSAFTRLDQFLLVTTNLHPPALGY